MGYFFSLDCYVERRNEEERKSQVIPLLLAPMIKYAHGMKILFIPRTLPDEFEVTDVLMTLNALVS